MVLRYHPGGVDPRHGLDERVFMTIDDERAIEIISFEILDGWVHIVRNSGWRPD